MGAEAAELRAVVSDGERLGGPMDLRRDKSPAAHAKEATRRSKEGAVSGKAFHRRGAAAQRIFEF